MHTPLLTPPGASGVPERQQVRRPPSLGGFHPFGAAGWVTSGHLAQNVGSWGRKRFRLKLWLPRAVEMRAMSGMDSRIKCHCLFHSSKFSFRSPDDSRDRPANRAPESVGADALPDHGDARNLEKLGPDFGLIHGFAAFVHVEAIQTAGGVSRVHGGGF